MYKIAFVVLICGQVSASPATNTNEQALASGLQRHLSSTVLSTNSQVRMWCLSDPMTFQHHNDRDEIFLDYPLRVSYASTNNPKAVFWFTVFLSSARTLSKQIICDNVSTNELRIRREEVYVTSGEPNVFVFMISEVGLLADKSLVAAIRHEMDIYLAKQNTVVGAPPPPRAHHLGNSEGKP